MKVCFLTEHYPPMDGGIATSAARIAQGLMGAGVTPTVFTFDASRSIDVPDYRFDGVDAGVRVIRFGPFFVKNGNPRVGDVGKSFRDKAILRRRVFDQMLRAFEADPADAVLSFGLFNAGLTGQLLSNYFGVPHVATARGNDIGTSMFDTSRIAALNKVLGGASAIVAVNEHLANRIRTFDPMLAGKVRVVPNGVAISAHARDSHRRSAFLRQLGWNEGDLVLGFAGSFREKKGAGYALKAMRRLASESDVPIRFLLVGPRPSTVKDVQRFGEDLEFLESTAVIHHTGLVERHEVAGFLVNADVLLMPSIEDGMSNALLEGMALGLCPVATDIFTDVVTDAVTGVIVPRADVDALVDAISRLARDRARVVRMGEAARQYVSEFHSAHTEAESYVDTLRAAVRVSSSVELNA